MYQTGMGRAYAGITAACAVVIAVFGVTVICLDRYTLTNFNTGKFCDWYLYGTRGYMGYTNVYYQCMTRSTCWYSTSPLTLLAPCAYLYGVGALALIMQAVIGALACFALTWAFIVSAILGGANAAWWLAAGVYFTNQIKLINQLSNRSTPAMPGGNFRYAVMGVIWAAFVLALVQLGAIIASLIHGWGRRSLGAGVEAGKPQPGPHGDQQMGSIPMPAYAGPPYGTPQAPAHTEGAQAWDGYATHDAQAFNGYPPQGTQAPAGYAPHDAQDYPAGYEPHGAQSYPADYTPQGAQSYPAGYAPQDTQAPVSYEDHNSYPLHGAQAPASYEAHNSYAPQGAQAPASYEAHNSYGPQAAQAPASYAIQGAHAPASYEAHNNYAPQAAQAPASYEAHSSYIPQATKAAKAPANAPASYEARSSYAPQGAQATSSYAPSAPQAPPSRVPQGAPPLANPFAGATGYAALNAGRWGPS